MSSLALLMAFFLLAGRSGGGEGAAIDDVLGAVDGPGPVGDQEGDEFGGFGGLRGPTDRDAAEGVHDLLPGRAGVDARASGDAVDQSVGAFGLNESGATVLTRTPLGPAPLPTP